MPHENDKASSKNSRARYYRDRCIEEYEFSALARRICEQREKQNGGDRPQRAPPSRLRMKKIMIVLLSKFGNLFDPCKGGQQGIRISIKRIARMTGHPEKTLRRAIAELNEGGWLNVVPTKSQFGQGANHITVNWHLIRSDCEEQGRQTQIEFFEAEPETAGANTSPTNRDHSSDLLRQKRDKSVTVSDGQFDRGCRSKVTGGVGQTDRGVMVKTGGGDGQNDQPCILRNPTDAPTNLPPKNYMHDADAVFYDSRGSRQFWMSVGGKITRDNLIDPKTIQGLYLDAVRDFPRAITKAAASRLTFFGLCRRFATEQKNGQYEYPNPGGILTSCMLQGWHLKRDEKGPRIEDEKWAEAAIKRLDFGGPGPLIRELICPPEEKITGFSEEDAKEFHELNAEFGPELEALSAKERGVLLFRAVPSLKTCEKLRQERKLATRLRFLLLRQMSRERQECEVPR